MANKKAYTIPLNIILSCRFGTASFNATPYNNNFSAYRFSDYVIMQSRFGTASFNAIPNNNNFSAYTLTKTLYVVGS